MSAYMKHRFPFLGITTVPRRSASKAFIAARRSATPEELLVSAAECWQEPEREFHYVGVDLLMRYATRLSAANVSGVERLIRTNSWWDTVDGLASNVVGPIVAADPTLAKTMDSWIRDADIWVARSAILHQLRYRDHTDSRRLFAYVELRAGDTEFFIRKACGWALREYAKTKPDAVYAFVDGMGDRLSGLTRREALKHAG
jgi:3-methyladenine DNA glycosylase AlkD